MLFFISIKKKYKHFVQNVWRLILYSLNLRFHFDNERLRQIYEKRRNPLLTGETAIFSLKKSVRVLGTNVLKTKRSIRALGMNISIVNAQAEYSERAFQIKNGQSEHSERIFES